MAPQLSMQEREIISQMRYAGENQAAMARRLDRHASTISREIGRNSTHEGYFAVVAQSRARVRRQVRWWGQRKMEQKQTEDFVRRYLMQYWSPEEIAGRSQLVFPRKSTKQRLSRQTIYHWIKKQSDRSHWESFLRRGGKKRHRPKKDRPTASCIDQRPAVVDRRTRYGDWEGDTVVGRRHRGALVTVVERKSGYLLVGKVQTRKADKVRQSIQRQYKTIPPSLRKTLTFDNGKEFSQHEQLADELNIDVYFAKPYCSWQRGTNENTNGLLRQFFPKGTDFTQIDSKQVTRAKKLLNNRPRKRLGYRTPSEVLEKYLKCCD